MVILYTLLISSFTLFNSAKAKLPIATESASSQMVQGSAFSNLKANEFQTTFQNWNIDHSNFLVNKMNENLSKHSTIGYRFSVDENGAIWILPNGTQEGKHLVEMGVEGHHDKYADAYAAFFAKLLAEHSEIYNGHKEQAIDSTQKSHIEHLFEVAKQIETKRSTLPARTAMNPVAKTIEHHTSSDIVQAASSSDTKKKLDDNGALPQASVASPIHTGKSAEPDESAKEAMAMAILEEQGIPGGLNAEARRTLAMQGIGAKGVSSSTARVALDVQGVDKQNGLNQQGRPSIVLDAQGVDQKKGLNSQMHSITLDMQGVRKNGLKPANWAKLALDAGFKF